MGPLANDSGLSFQVTPMATIEMLIALQITSIVLQFFNCVMLY